ncbi:YppG family protein [Fredinandcohnia sp. 179-A 10B2 NHS]|uniref:YppG family protein n=1 Tax=Fredinandcohnia sp. 179-A 10B2 NHS TaxID=3235176 RepID=UPI0039A387D0
MYYNNRRKEYTARQYGYSWPYYNQPNYQHFTNGYLPYPNNFTAFPQVPFQPNSFQGHMQYSPYPTPYPMQQGIPTKQEQKAVQGILSQFKKKDGTYDINKMMDTAGQMMGAVNQVNSIVKGLTKTFKV